MGRDPHPSTIFIYNFILDTIVAVGVIGAACGDVVGRFVIRKIRRGRP